MLAWKDNNKKGDARGEHGMAGGSSVDTESAMLGSPQRYPLGRWEFKAARVCTIS